MAVRLVPWGWGRCLRIPRGVLQMAPAITSTTCLTPWWQELGILQTPTGTFLETLYSVPPANLGVTLIEGGRENQSSRQLLSQITQRVLASPTTDLLSAGGCSSTPSSQRLPTLLTGKKRQDIHVNIQQSLTRQDMFAKL